MSLESTSRRSRRSILAAAAGGAAVLAAARMAGPEVTAAANPPLLLNQDNATTAMTSITTNGINALKVTTGTQATAIWAVSGSGSAVFADSTSATAVSAHSVSSAAVSAISDSGIAVDASAQANVAVRGWATTGVGVVGHIGTATPAILTGVALYGSVSSRSQVGIRAAGRVQFPDRSGRIQILKGKSSVTVPVAGATSSNIAVASLGTYRSGRWVAAAVCGTNKVTIYLNGPLTSNTWVNWFVIG